jgi:hypothetical protein
MAVHITDTARLRYKEEDKRRGHPMATVFPQT